MNNNTLKRLQNSDPQAFEDLFNTYYGKVLHFVNSIIKDQDAAKDLTQDIFIKFWEHREQMSINGNLDTYIYVMAKNRAINYIKRKQTEQTFIEDQNNKSSDELDQETSYLARDTLTLIESIVERMPPKRQKIFKLSRYIGLSHKEIAIKLNITTKTIENQINYALKEIKKQVK